jgi:hypothetical protein
MRNESHHEDGITGPSEGHSTRDNGAAYSPLTFDPTPYLHYLSESELSDEQKRELLETLWSIMVSFVDMGFNIGPSQQVLDKSSKQKSELASGFSGAVSSTKNSKKQPKRKTATAPKRKP